jgi:hypothetical protein
MADPYQTGGGLLVFTALILATCYVRSSAPSWWYLRNRLVWVHDRQLEPRTKLFRLMRQALAELSLPTAGTAIRRRMVYRSAVLEGRAVSNLGQRGVEATAEIEALIEEVLYDQ